MVERTVHIRKVIGSIPIPRTIQPNIKYFIYFFSVFGKMNSDIYIKNLLI